MMPCLAKVPQIFIEFQNENRVSSKQIQNQGGCPKWLFKIIIMILPVLVEGGGTTNFHYVPLSLSSAIKDSIFGSLASY